MLVSSPSKTIRADNGEHCFGKCLDYQLSRHREWWFCLVHVATDLCLPAGGCGCSSSYGGGVLLEEFKWCALNPEAAERGRCFWSAGHAPCVGGALVLQQCIFYDEGGKSDLKW